MHIRCNSKETAMPDKEDRELLQHLPLCISLNKAKDLFNDNPSLSSLLSSGPKKAFCNKLLRGHTTQLSTDTFYKLMW
jgi:hypothetical protein